MVTTIRAATGTAFSAALVALAIGISPGALAQHHQQHGAPYGGMQHRPIKALSDQQLADLRTGRGMGLALAAELNGYPGPIHVLELAGELNLTGDVQRRMEELYQSMKTEAVVEGEKLIAGETALDRAFAERTISPQVLADLTTRIGEAQARLRAIHLKYHLTTAELLSPEQRQRYAQLRGYR